MRYQVTQIDDSFDGAEKLVHLDNEAQIADALAAAEAHAEAVQAAMAAAIESGEPYVPIDAPQLFVFTDRITLTNPAGIGSGFALGQAFDITLTPAD